MVKLCECGCEQEIVITKWHKYKSHRIPKFITGHYSKTEEHKRNVSKIHTGLHHSTETKEIMRQHSLGNKNALGSHRSEKTRKKISEKLKGRYHTKKQRDEKRLYVRRGENHHNWNGGITPLSDQIRRLPEYKQWRSDVYQRDNWTCQTCEQRGGKLEAHHIKEFAQIIKDNNITNIWEAQFCEELWDINNGVTLCVECHNLTKVGIGNESKEKESQKAFKKG